MGKLGAGIFELARDRTPQGIPNLEALALETGVPVTFGCMPDAGNWPEWVAFLDRVAAAGGRAVGQAHSRPICSVWSFKTQLPYDFNPVWRELRALPLPEQRRRLQDSALRQELVTAAYLKPEGMGTIGTEARVRSADAYEYITVLQHPGLSNPSIAEVARQRKQDPVETVIELSLEHDFDQFFEQPLSQPNYDGLIEILRHPRTVATFSDSGAHVGQICDASLQTYLLSYWVREKQALTLEQAVRKTTFDPATAWGLWDRGLLRVGFAADIRVFDPEHIAPAMPEIAHDFPGGAKRLVQKAEGVVCTIVNGEVLIENGKHTGALPGRVLRGPLPQRADAAV
jgi:N-acyl-D-aspartate/D-glutamate deacylase